MEGDPESRREFARRMDYVGRILAVRNARMGRPLHDEELADLTQETLLKIWKKLPTYAGRASLKTWVYKFCYLELMNAVRRKASRSSKELSEDRADVPASEADATSEEKGIAVYLRHLAPREADVVRLHHVEDLSLPEIGAELGISVSSVKTHYYRALDKLRDVIDPRARTAREVRE